MKTFGILLGLLLTGLTALAQENGKTITVTVENILNDQGKVLASLHTAETFMKGAGVSSVQADAHQGEVTLTFKDVAPGTYAIMVLHDENENKRMDFDTNGMPLESYGMPGNEMTMGPPSFEDSKFEVTDQDRVFKIRF